MKNISKVTLSIIFAIILIGAVVAVLIINKGSDDNNDKTETSQTSEQSSTNDNQIAEQNDEKLENSNEITNDSKVETYISLADFESNKDSFNNQKKVYFFHASWCPICKSIDEDIASDTTQIPDDTTFIKTDFDTSTDLRKKYGVTTQYSFVQIDNYGNEIAQWSATNLDKAILGIN